MSFNQSFYKKKYRVCFITSLFADSYNLADKPGKFKRNDDYDYFLFTNLMLTS